MRSTEELSPRIAIRSKILSAQPDYLSPPVKTAMGLIYFRRMVALELPIPIALAYGHELAAVTMGRNVRVKSTFLKRLTAKQAPATLKNYVSAMTYSVAAMDILSRLRFLDNLCRFIDSKGDATGFETIFATAMESCWAYCNDDLATYAERIWLKYVPFGEMAKRDGIYTLNANTLTFEIYDAKDLKDFDISRKIRTYPNGNLGKSTGYETGRVGSKEWMEGYRCGRQDILDSLNGSGKNGLGGTDWMEGLGGGKQGALDSLGGSGQGGPGANPNNSPGIGNNPGYDPSMPGGNRPGQYGTGNSSTNNSPGVGNDTGYDRGMPGGTDPGQSGAGRSSYNKSPGFGIEVGMLGANRQGQSYLGEHTTGASPGWGGQLGNPDMQFRGPFGRGRSPGEQRMEDSNTGRNIMAFGAMLIGAVSATKTGGTPQGRVVVGIGLMLGVVGFIIEEGENTKGEKAPPPGSQGSAGGLPAEEADAGGEQTDEVPVIEDGDDKGKPDPNSSSGKPDPNSYRSAPDDEGGGGPNSNSASFPNSYDFYPDPNGNDGVGPNAAGARLRDVPVALGKGLQTMVRQLGDKSFRISP